MAFAISVSLHYVVNPLLSYSKFVMVENSQEKIEFHFRNPEPSIAIKYAPLYPLGLDALNFK